MKRLIFVLQLWAFVVFSCLLAKAQETTIPLQNKMKIGLNAGSMAYFGNGTTGFSTYLQPTLSYQVRPKLHFQTGLFLMNQQFGIYPTQDAAVRPYNGNTALITAGLAYDVNDKLQVSGMVYSNISQPNQQAINNFNNRNWGMMFNATYKVTENFHIQGTINVSNGRNSPWGNQWGNGFQTSPFGGFRNW